MKNSPFLLCLFLLLGPSLFAQTKTTHIRGTVEDAVTRKPIGGATVSASGDTAQQSEITDDNGFFRLVIEGVAPGDLVRIRVVKPGYTVYDRQIVTSEEIPIAVELRRLASAAVPKGTSVTAVPHKPLVSSDPVTARYIGEMTTQNNPIVRTNALKVIFQHAADDPAALAAVAAAVNDPDYRIREFAAYDLGVLGKATPEVIIALRIALDDPEPEVHSYAMGALGKFPKNKDAVDALFRVMGTPPNVNAYATMTLHNEGIDDPRITAALTYEATVKNDKNAATALGQLHQNSATIDALFASLGTPPNTNPRAMNILKDMNIDDPRLMAAFIDQGRKGNSDAILALGQYPQRKEAVGALFQALGTPPNINLTAMKVLGSLNIDDPRLTEAWITTATSYRSEAGEALLKKTPFSSDTVARLIAHVSASLNMPKNWITQIDLDLLLQGGEPARQALHTYLASADAAQQSQIAIAWLEVDHSPAAKTEILQDIRVPDVRAKLLTAAESYAKGFVSLPEEPSMKEECPKGLALRAAMGLTLLGIGPRDHVLFDYNPTGHPLDILTDAIKVDYGVCPTYAIVALGWLGPGVLNQPAVKAVLPILIHDLVGCGQHASRTATFETFAEIGNLNTLSQIGQAATATGDFCKPFNQERMNELTARIRTRLNAK